jgi:hypothetical protein
MPKYVYVQIHATEKAAKVEADKAEFVEEQSDSGPERRLILSLNNQKVGEFKGHLVDGWWIQDE